MEEERSRKRDDSSDEAKRIRFIEYKLNLLMENVPALSEEQRENKKTLMNLWDEGRKKKDATGEDDNRDTHRMRFIEHKVNLLMGNIPALSMEQREERKTVLAIWDERGRKEEKKK